MVAVAFVSIVTVWSELYHPLKDWLKNMFTHHWVGKGILAACIYIVLGGLLTLVKSESEESTRKLLSALFWVIILGFAMIAGFYVYEAFFAVHA